MAADDRPLWALTEHCCRACYGRVLERQAGTPEDGLPSGFAYRCSNCGTEAWHGQRRPAVICVCGSKQKGGRDMGLRCERQAEPSPEFPSEIVAGQSTPGLVQ